MVVTREDLPFLIPYCTVLAAAAVWFLWYRDADRRRRRQRRRASRREWDEYRHRRSMRARPPS